MRCGGRFPCAIIDPRPFPPPRSPFRNPGMPLPPSTVFSISVRRATPPPPRLLLRSVALPAVLALLLLLSAPALWAADSTPGILPIPPQQCQWQAGAAPPWTANASAWKPYTTWTLNPAEPYVWVRCSLDPASLQGLEHPALQLRFAAAYEVLQNGKPIGRNGNMRSGAYSLDLPRTFPLAPIDPATGPIALDLHLVCLDTGLLVNGPAGLVDARLGDRQRLLDARGGEFLAVLPGQLSFDAPFVLLGIVGCLLLSIWGLEHAQAAPIYLALYCIFLGLLFFDYFLSTLMVPCPVALYALGQCLGRGGNAVFIVLFYFAIAGRRVPVFVRALLAVVAFCAIFPLLPLIAPATWARVLVASWGGFAGNVYFVIFGLLGFSPFFAFWPWPRIAPGLRWIAGILMFDGVSRAAFFATLLANPLAALTGWRGALFASTQVASFLAVAALIGMVLRRQRGLLRQRAELAGEMNAAQEIQRSLVGERVESLDAFRIDVAFHPAREVGGDFYSCRILPGNRQRILIGDVSGKGAAAAMTAAVLLGAAQRRPADSPAALLRHLNLVLADMHVGGFATCLCADAGPDGRLRIANAGHLAPYRGEQEVALSHGLPLGVAENADYVEDSLQLAPGDSLTFISDGVVEARGPQGDFFGFERTRAISAHPAHEIADAARHFGQQDDITVLRIAFAGGGLVS